MTIRKHIISGTLLALLAAAPACAQADDEEQGEEYVGCGMLGAGIGAAVVAAGTATGANAWTVGLSAALGYGMQQEVDAYCDHVAEQTVEAYENAMHILGIQILWHTYYDPGMAWCLSIKEYDCIPYVDPADNPDPNQQAFVQQSWEAVRFAARQLLNEGVGRQNEITPLALANALQHGFESSGLQSSPTFFENRFNGIN